MNVTLPVSCSKIELVCLSYKGCLELLEVERAVMLAPEGSERTKMTLEALEKRRHCIMALYPDLDFETLPSRDALLLLDLTYSYSMNEPIASIKNSLAGSVGATTPSEPLTAPTVAQ